MKQKTREVWHDVNHIMTRKAMGKVDFLLVSISTFLSIYYAKSSSLLSYRSKAYSIQRTDYDCWLHLWGLKWPSLLSQSHQPSAGKFWHISAWWTDRNFI